MSYNPAILMSVLVLTEDSGSSAYDTVHALAKQMLKLLVPSVQMHRIRFSPLEDAQARQAMHANLWKSRNTLDERARRQLVRSIITKLLEDSGFVFYHIDGDCLWSEHQSSENIREFERLMLQSIQAGLRDGLRKRGYPDSELQERLQRLRLLIPYYSIEAWLYQNTREARALCGCNRCALEFIDRWEQDRASLDEELRPKEKLCFQDKHNAHLAKVGFPAEAVFKAGASFHHTALHLLECDRLTSDLQKTMS